MCALAALLFLFLTTPCLTPSSFGSRREQRKGTSGGGGQGGRGGPTNCAEKNLVVFECRDQNCLVCPEADDKERRNCKFFFKKVEVKNTINQFL